MKKDFVSDALRSGLNKRPAGAVRVLLWVLSTAVFFVFARYARYAKIDDFSGYRMAELQILTATVYTAIFAMSYGIQTAVGKRLPVYAASVATWAVTGIWHGLTPNFILWGMMNCFVIVVSEELNPLYEKFHNRLGFKEKKWYGGFEILRMFLLMNLIRVVDWFPDVGQYFSRMGSLFTTFNFHVLWDGTLMKLGLTALDYGILAFGIATMFSVSLFEETKGSIRERLYTRPVLRYALFVALLLIVLLMGSYGIGYDAGNFIYNRF